MTKSFYIASLAVFCLTLLSFSQAQGEQFKLLTLNPANLALKYKTPSIKEGKRDPFIWPAEITANLPMANLSGRADDLFSDLSLQGIIWDEMEPLAIINNKILMTGDHILDITIAKIKKDAVFLTCKNHSKNLRIITSYYEFIDSPSALSQQKP